MDVVFFTITGIISKPVVGKAGFFFLLVSPWIPPPQVDLHLVGQKALIDCGPRIGLSTLTMKLFGYKYISLEGCCVGFSPLKFDLICVGDKRLTGQEN